MKNLSKFLLVGLLFLPVAVAHGAINTLNSLNNGTQFLRATGTDANLSLRITSSSPSINFFQPIWSGILSVARGGTGTSTIPSIEQLLIGNGAGYSIANFIQGLNVVIANTAGSITISVTSTPAFASITLTNPLAATYGGTGIGSYVKGDILVAQDSNTLVRLPHGQDEQVLVSSSSASSGVSWGNVSSQGQKIAIYTNEISISNSTNFTELASTTIPANTLGTSNGIHGVLYLSRIGIADNQGSGGGSLNISISYGGVQISTTTLTNSFGINGPAKFDFDFVASSSATSQKVFSTLYFTPDPRESTSTSPIMSAPTQTISINSTNDQILSISAQYTSSTGGNILTTLFTNFETIK